MVVSTRFEIWHWIENQKQSLIFIHIINKVVDGNYFFHSVVSEKIVHSSIIVDGRQQILNISTTKQYFSIYVLNIHDKMSIFQI